jgi:hypothetical protein
MNGRKWNERPGSPKNRSITPSSLPVSTRQGSRESVDYLGQGSWMGSLANGTSLRAISKDLDRTPQDEREIISLKVDNKADALYLRLDNSKIVGSEEVWPAAILDFNADNQVVGVEVLNLFSG